MKTQCPLCSSLELKPVKHQQKAAGEYFICSRCDLIFLKSSQHIGQQEERDRYLQHRNSPEDKAYLQFLNQFIDPVLKHLPSFDFQSAKILDYGCGPSPALVLPNAKIEVYDPYFFPKDLSDTSWDLILSTEVFEHFRNPKEEIKKIIELLNPGGYLCVMTQFHQGETHFKDWWYVRDSTHVSFYSEKSFIQIAQEFSLEEIYVKNPVVVFRRPN